MNTVPFLQIQAFLSVARCGSFVSAARELRISRPAVSQSVGQLEQQLGTVLLRRTTRRVALTKAGRSFVENAGPAVGRLVDALQDVSAKPGETVGSLRLSVPRSAIPFVITPVIPVFRARHPRIDVEIAVESRFVDIVAEGYDAGVRLTEAIERDMVQVRLTDPFRFVVVGSPSYLAKNGTPEHPQDLLRHECIGIRSQTTGAIRAWEFERGRKRWRVPVRGGILSNDSEANAFFALQGLGLAYAFEPTVTSLVRGGQLTCVLEPFSPTVPGFFLYYPNRAQRSTPLKLFVETAKELAMRKVKDASPPDSSDSV